MWSANGERRAGKEVNPLMAGFVREALVSAIEETGNRKRADTQQLARASVLRRVIEDADANALHRIFCPKVKPIASLPSNENEVEKVILVAVRSIEALRPHFLIEVLQLAAVAT